MLLDADDCYRALETRDARFDGRFFVAVRSTGIYCRPICPAPTPKRRNCLFVACAAAAQDAGYRPCLRCRPEASPGTPAWLGTSATVSRALRLIGSGALDGGSVEGLAEKLGIGERHLRRLFLTHLGAAPVAVAQTRRLLFAVQLLDETELPMSQIALTSGYSSVRRFNTAIRETYRCSPTALRRRRGGRTRRACPEIELRLPFRAPYAWDEIAGFLARRAIPGVESVAGGIYRRTLRVDGVHGTVEVRSVPDAPHLVARIRFASPTTSLIQVTERLRRIFDLGADPDRVASALGRDRRLAKALRRRPGVRVPGAWDGFELAVRAILGQQVSVAGATTLAGRLVETHGEKLEIDAAGEGLHFLFPEPEVLAASDLTAIGLPRTRANAISRLAAATADGSLDFDASGELEPTLDRLRALPGIGDWTAQYIAMRALREPDAFPAGDLALRKALGTGGEPISEKHLSNASEAWRPWRAYAAMLLWSSLAAPAGKRAINTKRSRR